MKERSGFISSGSSAKSGRHPVGTIGRIRQKSTSRGVWVRRTRGDRRAFGSKSNNNTMVKRWSLVLSASALLVILSIFMFWAKRQSMVRDTAKRSMNQYAPSKPVIAPLPENEAIALVKKALAAKTPAEILASFRLSDSTPEQALDFLAKHIPDDPEQLSIRWAGMLSSKNLTLDIGMAEIQKESKADPRLLILTPDANEQWKLEFEAFARTSTPPWEEILANPAKGGTVRVTLGPDNYYNGPFSEDEWICYRLLTPDQQKPLFGYCRRDSRTDKAILAIATKGALSNEKISQMAVRTIRATLEIRRPEGAFDGQFEIARVLAEDWVATDQVFEEQF